MGLLTEVRLVRVKCEQSLGIDQRKVVAMIRKAGPGNVRELIEVM
jgi:hypothetical protein